MYRGRVPKVHQQTVTSTTAVIGLTGGIVSAVLQNDPDSTQDIYLGDGTNHYVRLEAGKSITVTLEDLTRIYVKTSTSTATLNIFAVR